MKFQEDYRYTELKGIRSTLNKINAKDAENCEY